MSIVIAHHRWLGWALLTGVLAVALMGCGDSRRFPDLPANHPLNRSNDDSWRFR